jgi:uncharacterized repeat protein (TIGR01451 family)
VRFRKRKIDGDVPLNVHGRTGETHAAAGRGKVALIIMAVLCAVLAASFGARAGELAEGGDFETGDFTPAWVHGAGSISGPLNPDWADHIVVLDLPYGGNYSALLGFKYEPLQQKRYAFMYQDVTIPSGISRATLYFKFRQQGYDGLNNDPFTVEVRDLADNTLATVVTYAFPERDFQFKDSGWIDDDGVGPVGYDMMPFAGQTVRIYFRQANGNDNTYETWVFVDDVSLVFEKYVDLIVDGEGEDLFGDLGTGDGGTSVRSGEAGETITYLLDVENEGEDADSYTLSAAPPPGWGIIIRYGGTDYSLPWTTPVVPADSVIRAEVLITIPPDEAIGGYTTILDAVSAAFGDRFDSAALVANVVPAKHLADLAVDGDGFGTIDPDGAGGISYVDAPPDTEVTFQVDLLNAGTEADSFFIWFRPAGPFTAVIEDGAVTHSAAFVTGLVNSGGTVPYTLRVTVPVDLLGGDYTTLVYAKSLTDTLKKDGVSAVTRVLAPRVDMVICGSGDGIVDDTGSGQGGSGTVAGTRSNTVYFPFTLQNEGGVADSFLLAWDNMQGGWTAQIFDGVSYRPLPWVTPAIEPYGERDYLLAVTIPGNVSYGTHASILDATSEVNGNVRESVTANITVCSGFEEVDLLIDGNGDGLYGPLGTGLGGSSAAAAGAGDTVTFTITVENEGGENLFDLEWSAPPGWEVVIGDSSSTMRGVPAGAYVLEVRIPSTCSGGTFEIIVDGRKTNKPFFIDSVKGIVSVEYAHIVDALVDGDGDDIFGMPGAGGGGLSTRSTLGGEAVQFTVELQNQGGEAESYRVTWNGFTGWNATLDGSGPPFVTVPVPAGGSESYIFEVTAPLSALEGDYDYTIDVVSTVDSSNVESVTARVHIDPPPQPDLVIDGNGALITAPAGSGGGGRALVFGDGGTMVTAVLEVVNRGGFPDSFRVTWQAPIGWPAGSILISDGSNDYGSPFVTGVVDPGASLAYTVKIFVPAAAPLRSSCIIDAEAISRDTEDSVLLEIGTACFVIGMVFDDADHDGARGPGESGWSGVTVILTDPGGDITAVTGATGGFTFEVPAGTPRQVIELTPSGMVSLSPDTVALGAMAAGDTVTVDFADVLGPVLAPEINVSGPAGGFVDLPHTITAGTAGQAVLTAVPPAGWVEAFYRDNNGDSVLDAGDTPLTPADLDLDPAVPGLDVVPIIMHVFIPSEVPPGTVEGITVTLAQTLSGTTVVAQVSVTDTILVLASASGTLQLTKSVDLIEARPGDVITYTISFINPGADGVQEIEIIDPVSADVDLVTDAFGPGQDINWVRDGAPVYLTADPADADEAMLSPDGTLRIVLSRQAPFVLGSGEEGQIIYQVRIR